MWRYCEDSARWVFQTETGNKNADRILAALRVAAKKGLTKWQITVDVFNRNVPKFEIDEALRLLHQLRLTYCVIEKTATKPAERWFEKARPYEEYDVSQRKATKTQDSSYSSCPPAHKTAPADVPKTGNSVDVDAQSKPENTPAESLKL